MSEPRSALRVIATDVAGLVDQVNGVLSRLLGQDRRRWNLEPARKPVVTVTATYAASEGDMLIRVDASGGARTVTLPPAAAMKGLTLTVKKIDATGNAVTVDADGAETIDGATTQATSTQWGVLRLVSNGTTWDLI